MTIIGVNHFISNGIGIQDRQIALAVFVRSREMELERKNPSFPDDRTEYCKIMDDFLGGSCRTVYN